MEVYLLNTGRIRGQEDDASSEEVKIKHNSAIIEAILYRTNHWNQDSIFHYEIAAVLPDFENPDLLNPYQLYKGQEHLEEYQSITEK